MTIQDLLDYVERNKDVLDGNTEIFVLDPSEQDSARPMTAIQSLNFVPRAYTTSRKQTLVHPSHLAEPKWVILIQGN